MGFFAAIWACYANMFNFTGRARRAEYWYFVLFQLLLTVGVQIAFGVAISRDPNFMALFLDAASSEAAFDAWLKNSPQAWTWAAYALAANLIFLWLPHLAVTFRRLHDTGRSGWFMLMPFLASLLAGVSMAFLAGLSALVGADAFALIVILAMVPLGASIWFLVVLCLPGTLGNNKWGGDPVPFEQRRRTGDHPAFMKNIDPKMKKQIQAAQRAEFQDYYNARVLPAIKSPPT